jgi:uncharacterized protein (TIGR02453 family)
MEMSEPIFNRETFRFFRDLKRHNKKTWMDVNRERYRQSIVLPLRRLLEATAPDVLELDSRFDTTGRNNFSRINRDIRFAKDKTLYKTQMYLRFSVPLGGGRESGQLYAGISTDTATAGYAIYGGPKRRESAFALIAEPRFLADPNVLKRHKRRLARRYESYWYSTVKGEWKKHDGWPSTPEDWKKIGGWVVRKKFKLADAMRATYPQELIKVFRDVYPLLGFSSLPD